jgi:hypothetical protein
VRKVIKIIRSCANDEQLHTCADWVDRLRPAPRLRFCLEMAMLARAAEIDRINKEIEEIPW